jgi:hypothetical protein
VTYAAFITSGLGSRCPLLLSEADRCLRRRTAKIIIATARRHATAAMTVMMGKEPPPDDVLSVVEDVDTGDDVGASDTGNVGVVITAEPTGDGAPVGEWVVVVVSTGGGVLEEVGCSVGGGDGSVFGVFVAGADMGMGVVVDAVGGDTAMGVSVVTTGAVGTLDGADGAFAELVGVKDVVGDVGGVVSEVGTPATVGAAVKGAVVGCACPEDDTEGVLVVVVGVCVASAVVGDVDGAPVVAVVGDEVVGVGVVGPIVGTLVGVGVVGVDVGTAVGAGVCGQDRGSPVSAVGNCRLAIHVCERRQGQRIHPAARLHASSRGVYFRRELIFETKCVAHRSTQSPSCLSVANIRPPYDAGFRREK